MRPTLKRRPGCQNTKPIGCSRVGARRWQMSTEIENGAAADGAEKIETSDGVV